MPEDTLPDSTSLPSWPALPAAPGRVVFAVIAAVTVAVIGFIFWLVYVNAPTGPAPAWTVHLPLANAVLNGSSALCLLAGVLAVKRQHYRMHVMLISLALAFSALFLISYIVHHAYHGDTRFPGQGWIRPVYFFILISHIVLSAAVVPMILTALFFALSAQYLRHRRVAVWTFPIWMYVSVTGVLVFLFLSAYA